MKTNHFYPDLILNAFKSVQAWKSLALVLLGVLVFETIALGWMAGQRTVLLVPQHLKAPTELNLGEPYAPDYMTAVAKSDLFALLNWTPDNIDSQYGLFLARLTPELHSAQRDSLLAESQAHRNEDLTQSFYVTRSSVSGATVTLNGVLVRSTGGREVFRGPAVYALRYTDTGNGMLLVAGVEQPGEREGSQDTSKPAAK